MTYIIGISTGALSGSSPDVGVAAAVGLGLPVVEVSALSEPELPAVLELVDGLAGTAGLEHVVVHAPAKRLSGDEAARVQLLHAADLPVVLHPDVVGDFALWAPLGSRLLVENMDFRKGSARTVSELSEVFSALPEAGLCLDVSHALSVGGPDLVFDLHSAFSDRLAQVHVGCASGTAVGELLEGEVLEVLGVLDALLERPTPLVLERALLVPFGLPVPAALAAQVVQLKELVTVR